MLALSDVLTDDELRAALSVRHGMPMTAPRYDARTIHVGAAIKLSRTHPVFSAGVGDVLERGAHFYRRWFELPDLGMRGWAIILRVRPPDPWTSATCEHLAGWVEAERQQRADEWIRVLNDEIAARLTAAGAGGIGVRAR